MVTEMISDPPIVDFGPDRYGVELLIDPEGVPDGKVAVVDVETDEKGNFVGIGVMCDPLCVRYYSTLGPDLISYLGSIDIVGHNLKFDAHQLQNWGVAISSTRLAQDTMLKSYVCNTTKESHGLKELAKEYLNMEWPSYDDMVGIGKDKITLDKQDVAKVAAYCGDDCVATYRLNQYFDRKMNPAQKGYYNNIELPTMRLLFRMENKGVTVDVDYLKQLKVDFEKVAEELMAQLSEYIKASGIAIPCVKSCPKREHIHEFKPKSPKQVLFLLNAMGIPVQGTDRNDLAPHMNHEFVSLLAECRKVQSMLSKFVNKWLGLPTLPKIHTTFSQVSLDEESGDYKGIRTGRLSSKDPNLQQVKRADSDSEEDYGRVLRSAFIPSPGKSLLVFDFDQFQYRLLAHFTKEPVLLGAFQRGEDVHEATGKVLFSKDHITKFERSIAKNCNFGAVFGAQAEKIAAVAGCSIEEADKFLRLYWQKLPGVTRWINRTKMLAHVHKSVKTIFGRVIPLPGIDSRNRFEVMHTERQAVNFIIQGSEADIIKMAMLRTDSSGDMPILQVHDELHFEVEPGTEEIGLRRIRPILEGIVTLDIPILASGGTGPNWYEAK